MLKKEKKNSILYHASSPTYDEPLFKLQLYIIKIHPFVLPCLYVQKLFKIQFLHSY